MTSSAEAGTVGPQAVIDIATASDGVRQDEVSRLAAVRAAIDPERRYIRADLLVSVIVEALARGSRTEIELLAIVKRSWATGAVTESMLARGLQVAEKSYLVMRQTTLTGDDAWTLTEGVREEAQRDGEWAGEVLAEFEAALGDRLAEYTEVQETPEQLSRIARHLFSGLAEAVEGTYQTAADSAAPGKLRPLEVDGRAVVHYMRRARIYDGVSSRRRRVLARAIGRAVAAVLDATDDFGNELLRLLTIGNILQGLLSARDVAGQRVAQGTRILLDTTTLVYSAESGTPGRQMFDELVERSKAAGVEVVVALHTLEEYEGLWAAADSELDGRTGDELIQLADSHVLVGNPFVREFLRLREEQGRDLSWQRFQVGRRAIREPLAAAGITVTWHGNESDDCQELASEVEAKLKELSADPRSDANRTDRAARADAWSCAMVARWRRERPAIPVSAWFVARERLTGRAYRSLTRDSNPLTVSPESWLLYLSHIGNDDSERQSLAVTLGDVAARQHFLSVAAAYTTADVLRFAGLLGEGGGSLAKQDLQKAVQLDLLKLLDEPEEERRGTRDVRDLADRVMKDRSQRRDVRAQRATQEAQRKEEQAERLLASRVEAVRAEERIKRESRLFEQREQLERKAEERAAAEAAEATERERAVSAQRLQAKNDELEASKGRRARDRRWMLAATLVALPAWAVSERWSSLSQDGRLLAVSAMLLLAVQLVAYGDGRLKNIWWVLVSVVTIGAGLSAEIAVSNLWSG